MEGKNKKGQVWIETVIYTLIGLSLIGLVLGIATPRINELKDKAVIEQTIDSLNQLDSKVNEVLSAPGNSRTIDFKMKRGSLYFDTVNNQVIYELEDSRTRYSEPGVSISIGRLNVTTSENTKSYNVRLLLDYGRYDLTFDEKNDESVKFTQTSVPYRFQIENQGFEGSGSNAVVKLNVNKVG